MRLLVGQQHDAAVARWVADRIPFVAARGFGKSTAIGITGNDGRPLAGVVFHDWQPGFGTLAFSIAADSPRWATRRMVGALLAYPFEELKVQKLWTATPHTNKAALRLLLGDGKKKTGVGFKQEATLIRHFGPNVNAVISRMFDKEYLRLYGGNQHGKARPAEAA